MEKKCRKDLEREERTENRIIVIKILVDWEKEQPDIGQDDPQLRQEINVLRHFFDQQERWIKDLVEDLTYRFVQSDVCQRDNRQGQKKREKTE